MMGIFPGRIGSGLTCAWSPGSFFLSFLLRGPFSFPDFMSRLINRNTSKSIRERSSVKKKAHFIIMGERDVFP